MNKSERQIIDGLVEVNELESDDGIEWGQYIERKDADGWTALVYTTNFDEASAHDLRPDSESFRNCTAVKRVVGDWKPA